MRRKQLGLYSTKQMSVLCDDMFFAVQLWLAAKCDGISNFYVGLSFHALLHYLRLASVGNTRFYYDG